MFFFLDERSFSHRCNLISKQGLCTEKMHKKLVLNVIFSMNHRFHVKLSCNYITGGKQERHKRNLRSKKVVFYKRPFLHETILKTVSMRFHRKHIEYQSLNFKKNCIFKPNFSIKLYWRSYQWVYRRKSYWNSGEIFHSLNGLLYIKLF